MSNEDKNVNKYYDKDKKQFNKEYVKDNLNSEIAKEYVDELYKILTGRLGDPASSNYLVKSLQDGSLSVQQAELHVRFSKEAKQYAVIQHQKEEKRKKAEEYIYELYKAYVGPDTIIPLDELEHYTNLIVDGQQVDYQSIEDEIKEKALLNVQVPKKKPFFK
eukprot:gene3635-4527_t